MTDDQKRALGIGGIGLAALIIYRRTRGGRTTVQPVATTSQIAPYTPQAPLPLQPGESVYDPNSQALLTTPAGLDTTSSNAGPGNQTAAAAAPSYTVNVRYPTTVRMVRNRHKPTKRAAAKKPKKPAKKAVAHG